MLDSSLLPVPQCSHIFSAVAAAVPQWVPLLRRSLPARDARKAPRQLLVHHSAHSATWHQVGRQPQGDFQRRSRSGFHPAPAGKAP